MTITMPPPAICKANGAESNIAAFAINMPPMGMASMMTATLPLLDRERNVSRLPLTLHCSFRHAVAASHVACGSIRRDTAQAKAKNIPVANSIVTFSTNIKPSDWGQVRPTEGLQKPSPLGNLAVSFALLQSLQWADWVESKPRLQSRLLAFRVTSLSAPPPIGVMPLLALGHIVKSDGIPRNWLPNTQCRRLD